MSAKRLSTKELLAQRNPLMRTVVAPVDIYAQVETASREAKKVATQPKKSVKASRPATKTQPKTANKSTQPAKKTPADDPVNPYSTYLRRSQVKQIKHRAVDMDVKDQHIVQAAIDEYFSRHSD